MTLSGNTEQQVHLAKMMHDTELFSDRYGLETCSLNNQKVDAESHIYTIWDYMLSISTIVNRTKKSIIEEFWTK